MSTDTVRQYDAIVDQKNRSPEALALALTSPLSLGTIRFEHDLPAVVDSAEVEQVAKALETHIGNSTVERIDVYSVAEDETRASSQLDLARGEIVADPLPSQFIGKVRRFVVPAGVLATAGVSQRIVIVLAPTIFKPPA